MSELLTEPLGWYFMVGLVAMVSIMVVLPVPYFWYRLLTGKGEPDCPSSGNDAWFVGLMWHVGAALMLGLATIGFVATQLIEVIL